MAKDDTLSGNDRVVAEAKGRLKRCKNWESTARGRMLADQRFVEGDSDNNFQWDDSIRNKRTGDAGGPRPCLTINKTRQHCLNIVNEARQNKATIQVHPTGGGSTYESAQAFQDVVRHVEYQSNATEAYEAAIWHQVTGGIGYVRVVTDYADTKSFDQEIFIRRVKDPFTVYLDPDIEEFDGSDARFGFIVKQVPRDEFEDEYPELKDDVGSDPLDAEGFSWADEDHVWICEYYRKRNKADKLIALVDGTMFQKSDVPAYRYNLAKTTGRIQRERDVIRDEVEWFKIVGGKIADRSDWPGKFIPIARFVGEETVFDGVMDRHGHVRALKDPQRMYNYNSSAYVEHVALQTKAPYLAPVRAVEGYETYWNNANQENYAYLPYNDIDDQGQKIAEPKRLSPPMASQAYIEGMKAAQMEMMMASGQYQAQMGENENAKSGIAIQTRQRQGANATYHYIDHQAQAIKFVGRIVVDLVPKIYDTERVLKIRADDGTQTEITVDPNAQKAQTQMVGNRPVTPEQFKQAQKDENLKSQVKTIFNPAVGEYDVQVDVGPAFATRREETVNALTQLMAQNKELAQVAGDILFRNMDFAGADAIAERLEKLLPPQITGDGPSPQIQEAMQAAQQQQQALQEIVKDLSSKLADAQQQIKDRDREHELKEYDSETRRLATVNTIDPAALVPVVRNLVSEILGERVEGHIAAHTAFDQSLMPQPEAEMEMAQ